MHDKSHACHRDHEQRELKNWIFEVKIELTNSFIKTATVWDVVCISLYIHFEIRFWSKNILLLGFKRKDDNRLNGKT